MGPGLELKSKEDCWIVMTRLCVHSSVSAGRPGVLLLAEPVNRRELDAGGEGGVGVSESGSRHLIFDDLRTIMMPASFPLPTSLLTSLLANSTQNHTEKGILGNITPNRTIQHHIYSTSQSSLQIGKNDYLLEQRMKRIKREQL